jgi:flagellar secretion chaperone FliS
MSATLQISFSAIPSTRPAQVGGSDADPHGFIGDLMDGALERIRDTRDQWAHEGSTTEAQHLLRTAKVILSGLRVDLDLLGGDALAANLDDLYDYMSRRLRAAELTQGVAALDEVSHLLEALRAAWVFMPAEVRKASRN